jgi:Flp pilus assembly protein TadD
MFLPQHHQSCRAGRFASAGLSAILVVLARCGCQTTGTEDITGALGEKADARRPGDSRRDVETYRERFQANLNDAKAALQYGKALRDNRQRSQAVAVLEQATISHPGDKALLAGYGRALADNGNFQQAFDVRAHTPKIPIGGYFRLKALSSTNLAGTTKRGSITRVY